MVSLQPKLNLRVAQRQILTPGLMQMVSVLALNKIELKDMIQTEIAENPVLEELEETVPMLDHVAEREADRELAAQPVTEERTDPADPFEEIDFGSYFQEYLDPGFRSPQSFEINEKPSIENYLTQPGSLNDHLQWQVGSLSLAPLVRGAVDYILGNLDEDGYCASAGDELHAGWLRELAACGDSHSTNGHALPDAEALLAEALAIVRALDPPGIAAADLRECLLLQIEAGRRALQRSSISRIGPQAAARRQSVLQVAYRIVDSCLELLHKRDTRELARAAQATPDDVQDALEFIRTLDPRPGQRFQQVDARLIEPDVSFVKRDDVYIAVMDDEILPSLRLNRDYRKLLQKGEAEKDVKDYVKERYRSALQLMRNIEQRKNTILRTCEAIVRRQGDFLEHGVESLRPMMIKEVAEEIGVHPSTVSRAVSNKYAHTPQGVFELRFFFSEGVNGPEGSGTPLLLLKRRVKKLIEDEDPRRPLTDDHITQLLQKDGIDVTRRTVAKYREDMRIPSTHQRRIRG
jgi:RNA polymerase sigma-54 factor